MAFPIQFMKKSGDYDFISPIVNFGGNCTVLSVGGISVAAVSAIALKALGFSGITASAVASVPFVIGAFAFAGAITATAMLVHIARNINFSM